MDIWGPYVEATLRVVPHADEKIVFDRFHLMRHMTEAVDTVRKQEHRAVRVLGNETLTGTKYPWLRNEENVPESQRATFETLKGMNLKVGRAWAIKESLRCLCTYPRPGWARRFFQRWYWWATHSRLEPVRRVAHLFRRHLTNILSFCRHWLTNSVAEGLNSKIMAIKRRACGYRNENHFKMTIYF